MKHTYIPRGVCARKIEFDVDDGQVKNVQFTGGCDGNLKAISKLVDGMTPEQISGLLAGNTCGLKPTSCADQLAKAVMEAKNSAE